MKLLSPTKHFVLRISAKMFDLLGLLSSFIIDANIVFQMMCKSKWVWDSILDRDLLYVCQWKHLTDEFETARNKYTMISMLLSSAAQHRFTTVTWNSDVLKLTYAAVVHLHTEYENGHVSACLISSKITVAPVKEQTFSRLEPQFCHSWWVAFVIILILTMTLQGRRNVFTTGPTKLDHEDYAIKCVGGRQLHEYWNPFSTS